jgi:hypothetical protein
MCECALARTPRPFTEEFGLDQSTYEQLRREVERWRGHAIELAQRREPRQDSGLDLGPEL